MFGVLGEILGAGVGRTPKTHLVDVESKRGEDVEYD
jgi:hypothetical protein